MIKALFIIIFLPLVGAFLSNIFSKKYKSYFSSLILFIAFLFCLFLLPQVVREKFVLYYKPLLGWFNFSFIADGLSIFMAFVSLLVALLISLYSTEYMRQYPEQGTFYFWMLLFVGAMMGLVFSNQLILLYCFWEMTSVCSWRLIAFYRKDQDLKAADKAFLVTFFGAALMLIGILLIYLQYGTLDLGLFLIKRPPISSLAAFLILAGIIAKSAQLPLQTWLPDAGVAPTPVTALLHAAVLVKIGVYVFARIFCLSFLATPFFFHSVIILSLATIMVGAASALVEDNLKRILAYSTISQLGYIMLALALNTYLSLKIALIYILAHSLAKAGLFLCAGIIEHKTGTKDIRQLGGLLKAMPYTATAYLLCAFSIIGLPPFLGFWPKFMLILSYARAGYILAAIVAVLGAVFTMFYLFRLYNYVFLGEPKIAVQETNKSFMVFAVLILGILSLVLGLLPRLAFNFINKLI